VRGFVSVLSAYLFLVKALRKIKMLTNDALIGFVVQHPVIIWSVAFFKNVNS
jgi:hypothetical protein